MKALELLDKKQKIMVIGAIIFIIIIILYYFYTKYQEMEVEANPIQQETIQQEEKESQDEETKDIIIHISGAIQQEGIIKIKEGARISDIIEAAGGLTEEASLKNVNLAYMVEDGQKIYIPTKEEEEQQEEKEEYTIVQDGNTSSSSIKKEGNGKVNINKATQTELEELPGIGASMALRIIQYREENGSFHSIEDIKNVSGIGEAKYNNIKDNITV